MEVTFKTPIEEIFFRSSKIGLLAGGLIRNDLTDKQKERMKELETRQTTIIGLSDTQQAKLDKYEQSIKDGKQLTPKQSAERDDFKKRLVTTHELTDKQKEELAELKERDGAEPTLSQGAKTYIKEVWLKYEKGFEVDVQTKYTEKGKQAEEDGINLISYVDGIFYKNNNKNENGGRVSTNNLTGACDVVTDMTLEGIECRVVDDIKASWNPLTFMTTNYSTLEEWQGRAYMYLYGADVFRLRRCLLDCPPDVFADEYKKFCFLHGIIDDSNPDYAPLIEQFERNFLYENSGLYNQEERVKTFAFVRDLEKEKTLLKSIELGLEYYKTITLNMIE